MNREKILVLLDQARRCDGCWCQENCRRTGFSTQNPVIIEILKKIGIRAYWDGMDCFGNFSPEIEEKIKKLL